MLEHATHSSVSTFHRSQDMARLTGPGLILVQFPMAMKLTFSVV